MDYHGPKDRLDAARSPDTEPEELAGLSQSQYVFVREAVAANPGTPTDVLESFVPASLESSDDTQVLLALLRNPVIRPETCEAIGRLIMAEIRLDASGRFRAARVVDALVQHPSASAETLAVLIDPGLVPKCIRRRVAVPGVRRDVLRTLLEDPSSKIRSRARRALDAGQ